MNDLLSQWITQNRSTLEARGFVITLKKQHVGGCYGVDLGSSTVVGSIAYWPPELFEFQFNSCATGDVVVLETCSLASIQDLNSFFDALQQEKLV